MQLSSSLSRSGQPGEYPSPVRFRSVCRPLSNFSLPLKHPGENGTNEYARAVLRRGEICGEARSREQMISHASPSPIVGRALLVSTDTVAVEQIASVMRKFAILPEICTDIPAALGLINTRKYEAVVLDHAFGEHVAHLLERVRFSPSNQNSVTFVMGDLAEHAGPPAQPNFIMPKPLSDTQVQSTLRAALGSIIHEYRRYFRCSIALPITIQIDDEIGFACEMINISEGGLAVNTPISFPVGAAARVQFTLPGESAGFDIQSDIFWSDSKSRAGLHFRFVPPDQKSRLQDWLSRRIEQGLPGPIARLFQKEK
jgi:PilZ domain